MLIAVYALAALFLLVDERAGASAGAQAWSRGDWVGAIVLGIGAIILFSAVVGAHSQTWFIATGFYRHRTIVYGLWAAGAFAIGARDAAGGRAGGARAAPRRGLDARS